MGYRRLVSFILTVLVVFAVILPVNIEDADAATKVAAPVISVKVVHSCKFAITWDKVENAEKYAVYRATEKNGTYKRLSYVSGTKYTNYTVVPGQRYYYKVKAVGAYGFSDSSYSNIASGRLTLSAYQPEIPKNLIKATVTKVVDGDTIWVTTDPDEKGFKVRYIGIDTPESVHADASKNTPEGVTASNRNKTIITQARNTVYLEYDVEETDRYGRSLCYVYVSDGKNFVRVEDILLKDGMCQIMTIQPNSRYADWFLRLQKNAREKGYGFW